MKMFMPLGSVFIKFWVIVLLLFIALGCLIGHSPEA